MAQVKPIPDGYHSVTPYLIVKDGAAALDFYVKAFDAKVLFKMAQPDGRVGHAEIQIGDSRLMMADEFPEMGATSPATLGGSPVSLLIYVPDVDASFHRAVAAGAIVKRPLENKFYGDRMGSLEDPFGHQWHLGTHVEDVEPEELERRAKAEKG